MTYALRFFVFVAMASALCLVSGCLERPGQARRGDDGRGRERVINLFDPEQRDANAPGRGVSQSVDTRRTRMRWDDVSGGFNRRTALYGTFLAIVVVIVAGLVYWQIRQRKQAEWELNDPMALVKELNFVHQLSDQEQRLMKELSDRKELSSPLKLFVEPKFLLEALESDSFVSARPSVRQLLSKLFDITDEKSEISIVGMDSDMKL